MKEKSAVIPDQYPLLPAMGFIHLGDPDRDGVSKLEEGFQPIFECLQQADYRAYLGYELFSNMTSDEVLKTLDENREHLVLLHLHSEETVNNSKFLEALLKSINHMPVLKLVFLDGFAQPDLIQAFFDVGTPAVVATSKNLDDAGYLRFLIDFYQNILKGKNLNDALDRASWELREETKESPSAWRFFTRKESIEYLKRVDSDADFPLPPGIYVNQDVSQMPKWEIYHPENQPDDFSFLKPLYPTQTRLHSDRWGEEDFLGYEPYARVIAGIINDKDSEPPLTIAIIAPWGYGKTTLMHYIRERLLKDKAREDIPSPSAAKAGYQQIREWVREGASNDPKHYHPVQRPMVWFNPWHYQSSEQVWSGMAHSIITQLVENLPPLEQEEFWFKLQFKRIDFQAIRLDIHKSIITRLIPYLLLFILAVIAMVFAFSMGADLWEIISGLFASGSIGQAMWQWYSRRSKGVEEKYDQYLSAPNYESGMGLFHEVNEDLSTVFELLVSPEKPVVVFIDDLDRCSPEKVVEVTEAINLLVNGDYRNKCFFVIGMDAQVVAAALDVAYRGMRGKLKDREEAVGSVGWYFLDKFIQLPFIIPSLNNEKKSNYLHNLFKVHSKEEHEDNIFSNPLPSAAETSLSDEELKQKARKLLELSQNNEDRTAIEKIRKDLGKKYEKVIDGLILDRALESNKDDGAIFQQLRIYSDFLQPSPRSLKRFANMLRFHTTLQQLKDTKSFDYAPTESLAKWLTISLRWPQLVRWIQWERADKFIAELGGDASPEKTPRKLFLSKPREKAGILDELINRMPSFEDIKSPEEKDELYYQQWLPFAEANRDLSWLKDKELFLILYEKNHPEARLEKALDFNVW